MDSQESLLVRTWRGLALGTLFCLSEDAFFSIFGAFNDTPQLPLNKLAWVFPWYALPSITLSLIHPRLRWGFLGFLIAGRMAQALAPFGVPAVALLAIAPLIAIVLRWHRPSFASELAVWWLTPLVLGATLQLPTAASIVLWSLYLCCWRLPPPHRVFASLPLLGFMGSIFARISTHADTPTPVASSAQPDVVLIVVDTLRSDHLGAYGYSRATSPHIDSWSQTGLVFRQAQSPASWTLPAFASLMTGLEPFEHRTGVSIGRGNTESSLAHEYSTLAERLSEAGYRTMAITTNGYLKRPFGLDQGFDWYDDALGSPRPFAIAEPFDAMNLPILPWRTYRPADEIVDQAVRWWKASEGGPRFLMLHLMDPHKPLQPPNEHRIFHGRTSLTDNYDAEIHFVDAQLGRWFKASEGAITVLTSDHGEELGERQRAYPGDSWPEGVRHGHTQYQELLHVPLILAGPNIPEGHIERPVSTRDVHGTLLRAAGLDVQRSLPEVFGDEAPPTEPLRSQFVRVGTEKTSVRIGRWKWIHTAWGEEVYDLSSDPRERRPLSIEERPLLTPEFPPSVQAPSVALPDELLQQLKALGYAD